MLLSSPEGCCQKWKWCRVIYYRSNMEGQPMPIVLNTSAHCHDIKRAFWKKWYKCSCLALGNRYAAQNNRQATLTYGRHLYGYQMHGNGCRTCEIPKIHKREHEGYMSVCEHTHAYVVKYTCYHVHVSLCAMYVFKLLWQATLEEKIKAKNRTIPMSDVWHAYIWCVSMPTHRNKDINHKLFSSTIKYANLFHLTSNLQLNQSEWLFTCFFF